MTRRTCRLCVAAVIAGYMPSVVTDGAPGWGYHNHHAMGPRERARGRLLKNCEFKRGIDPGSFKGR